MKFKTLVTALLLSSVAIAAEKKITDFTLLPESSWNALDVLPIVDVSANTTKKTRLQDFETHFVLRSEILGIANGGTGANNKTSAFDALSPMTTAGDMIVGGIGGSGTRLSIGTNGYLLSVVGGVPTWTAPPVALPLGGTLGQILTKQSATDGDADWEDPKPPKTQGQSEVSAIDTYTLQVPYNQITTTGSDTRLIETGSENLLLNSDFEHQTASTSWTVATGSSAAVETSEIYSGKQALTVTLTSVNGISLSQDVTPTIKLQGSNLEHGLAIKTSLTTLQVCARHAGATVATCANVHGDNIWHFYRVNTAGPSSGSIGVSVVTTGSTSGTYQVDTGYTGRARNIGQAQNRYFAKMYRGGSTQTGVGPNNNDFKILPNTLDFDQMGIVNLSTNRFEFNSSYTCNFSGRVSILNTNTLASTYYYAKIKKNGVDQAGGSLRLSTGAGQYVADPVTSLSVNVAPGDYVELYLGSSGNNSVSTLTADIGNWNTFLAADCTPAASQAITPQNYSFNWVPYTPVISASTGTLTNYTVVGEYRRDSDGKLYLRGTLTFTGAAGTWANPRIGYPSGVPVISMGALYLPGVNYTDTGVNSWSGHYQVDTNYLVLHGLTGTNGVGIAINQSNPFAFGNTDVIKWFTGPIDVTGWISSQGAPQLVSSVTSNKTSSGWRGTATFGGASINTNCTSSPCELYNNPDPAFLKPTKNAGSGSYIINVAAGTCSTPLNCKATGVNVGSNVVRCDKSNFATTTTYGIDCSSPAGVANNAFVDIECSCDR